MADPGVGPRGVRAEFRASPLSGTTAVYTCLASPPVSLPQLEPCVRSRDTGSFALPPNETSPDLSPLGVSLPHTSLEAQLFVTQFFHPLTDIYESPLGARRRVGHF